MSDLKRDLKTAADAMRFDGYESPRPMWEGMDEREEKRLALRVGLITFIITTIIFTVDEMLHASVF